MKKIYIKQNHLKIFKNILHKSYLSTGTKKILIINNIIKFLLKRRKEQD